MIFESMNLSVVDVVVCVQEFMNGSLQLTPRFRSETTFAGN